MDKNSKIVVFGAKGLVGSSLVRELTALGYRNIIQSTRAELDLMDQSEVFHFFEKKKPDFVFMAAAKVGGIFANDRYRADFIYENLTIQNNILGAAHKHTPKKLLFLGSSCIYPRNCPQPIKEEYLLSSELEKTNEPYAIAKIAGLKTVESFRIQYGHPFFSVMPTNLYGPNDNFHPENSHVIPGLIRRMVEAKQKKESVFKAWGTGKPKREFMYVDDMTKACIYLMRLEMEKLPPFINIGTGQDISIRDLVFLLKNIIEFEGDIACETDKPDGAPQKLLDISKLKNLGWQSETDLESGLRKTVEFYINSQK